ncbi:MAG: DNA phosphorothioation-associated putative methyltransferase [Candidatus Sulfotelmatobacter sp.]
MCSAQLAQPIDEASLQNLRELHIKCVRECQFGKRVSKNLYLHISLVQEIAGDLAHLVGQCASKAGINPGEYNVVRLDVDGAAIAFLLYESLDDIPFPTLLTSRLYSLVSDRVVTTDFTAHSNPPILHRKETLLPRSHPQLQEFKTLTAELESRGAFKRSTEIGRRDTWNAILRDLGVRIKDHKVAATNGASREARPEIRRHLTAISRNKLSVPMRCLAVGGFLTGSCTVLDYGCGRGDDVRILKDVGIDARGWDPFFAPDGARKASQIVNLGFVLNVIEDDRERHDTLEAAWKLTERVLCVGVMLRSQSDSEEAETLTVRQTFQKYFWHAELREYVASVTGREPVSASPGVVLVFRDDTEEQDYLLRRQVGLQEDRDSDDVLDVLKPNQGDGRIELHKELLAAFWRACLVRAKILGEEDFPPVAEIRRVFGSPRRGLRLFVGEGLEDDLLAAAARRKEDMLLWLALNRFEQRKSSGAWPHDVSTDIRKLLGGRNAATKIAEELLFSLGNVEKWVEDFAASEARGDGFVDEDGDYMLLAENLTKQPLRIRMLVGCARRIVETGENFEVIRLNPHKRRVSWLHFDQFLEQPFPRLTQRIRVDLARADVDVLNYTRPNKRVLALKGMLLGEDKISSGQKTIEAWIISNTRVKKPTLHLTEVEAVNLVRVPKSAQS